MDGQAAEIKHDVIIRRFEENLPSMSAGRFLLYYFDEESNPSDVGFIVEVYPNGISHANEGYMSVKISMTLLVESMLQCTLSVVDNDGERIMLQSVTCADGYNRKNCIFERFVKHSTLMAQREKVLPDDVLSIQCEFNYCYNIERTSCEFLKYDQIPMNKVYCRKDNVIFQVPKSGPFHVELPSNKFRAMHEELIQQCSVNAAKIDDDDQDTLVKLLDYLCSNGASNSEEDSYSEGIDFSEYASKVKDMAEYLPGLLGLAYLHRDHPLKCTLTSLIRHNVLELIKQIRYLYIYSVPDSMQSSSTLGPEFLTFKSRVRLLKLYNIFDVLRLYIVGYNIKSLKRYCGIYLFHQMGPSDAIFIVMLADYYSDLTLKASVADYIQENFDAISKLPEWDVFFKSHPDLVEEIVALADASNDETKNDQGEEIRSYFERARQSLIGEKMEFYN